MAVSDREYNSLLQKYNLAVTQIGEMRDQMATKNRLTAEYEAQCEVVEKHARKLCELILAKDRSEMVLGKAKTWSSYSTDELIAKATAFFVEYVKAHTEKLQKLMAEIERRGDEIESLNELVRLAIMRAIKKSAIKKISAGNVTRNALVKKICHENMFGSYPDPSWVELVVEKLDRAGFINDTMYAKRFVEKALEKEWGEYKIRGSMRERGFKNEDIEKALEELSPDWEGIARAFCEKNTDASREALYRKLNTRGFPASIIISVLGE